MAQFEVFANPVVRARPGYPFVVVLQSDIARGGRERAVAPVAPLMAFPVLSGRLTPVITIGRHEFVLLVTSLTAIPVQALGRALTSVADRRDDILRGIDLLFFGV